MAAVRNIQDRPPPGGYKPISYKRHLPASNITGSMLFAGGAVVMAVGFYFVIEGRRQRKYVVFCPLL